MSTSPPETAARNACTPTTAEELDTLKHDLMKVEICKKPPERTSK